MRRLAQKWGSNADDDIPTEVPKPYTTPPGFKPPTLGEQWRCVPPTAAPLPLPSPFPLLSRRYAVMKHPYYRHGYALAILVGLIGYGIATTQKTHDAGSDGSDAGGAKMSAPGVNKSP